MQSVGKAAERLGERKTQISVRVTSMRRRESLVFYTYEILTYMLYPKESIPKLETTLRASRFD